MSTTNTTTETTAQLLKEQEAAKVLGISKRKLWGMAASGEISSIKIGRSKRYDLSDLQAFIASRKQGGTT